MIDEYCAASLIEFKNLQAKIKAAEANESQAKTTDDTTNDDDKTNNTNDTQSQKSTAGDADNNENNEAKDLDPNQQKLIELSGNILGMTSYFIQMDTPWKAMDFAKEVVKYDNVDPRVYDVVAYAAYQVNEFQLAKVAVEKAKATGGLRQSAPIDEIIDEQMEKWTRESELRAVEAERNDLPRVKLETSEGDIVLELFENEAPETVGNFVSLVEAGFYDGLTFHRVLRGFMAQGGCPDGDGRGGPGYNIYCECEKENARMHFGGSLSMAKGREKNSGGSQFFITFRPTPHLDGSHTVFGRVVEGMDTAASIQRITGGQTSVEPTKITRATVVRKRDHEYQPHKVGEDNGDAGK